MLHRRSVNIARGVVIAVTVPKPIELPEAVAPSAESAAEEVEELRLPAFRFQPGVAAFGRVAGCGTLKAENYALFSARRELKFEGS
jgi:hypothetical protein